MKNDETDVEKVSIGEVLKDNWITFLGIFILWLIFFIGTVWIGNDLSFNIFNPSMKLSDLGTFGDSFNVLTSLFTGLAFAGVIISIILQTQELKATRKEFLGQKEALQEQQKEMARQSFDNKFFQMLNLFNTLIDNLELKTEVSITEEAISKIKHKREVFSYLKDNLKKRFSENREGRKKKKESLESKKIFEEVFEAFNTKHSSTFKYYFINLYQILKYIDTNDNLEAKKKKEYMSIIRAQLSTDELILLFYNAIGVISYNKGQYKKLVNKYGFFEHLRYKDLNFGVSLPNTEDRFALNFLLKQYDPTAFGNNIELIEKQKNE